MVSIGLFPLVWRLSLFWLGVPPCWRAYFLLCGQKKVAKEKATPGSVPGYARFPALLEAPGGWLNSPAAQTTPADSHRRFCVARHLSRGPEERPGLKRMEREALHGNGMFLTSGPRVQRRATELLAEKGRGLSEGRRP